MDLRRECPFRRYSEHCSDRPTAARVNAQIAFRGFSESSAAKSLGSDHTDDRLDESALYETRDLEVIVIFRFK